MIKPGPEELLIKRLRTRIEALKAALREARQYVFAFTGDEDNETRRNSSSLLIEIDAALDKDAGK